MYPVIFGMYLSLKMWINCTALETSMSAYRGLKDSLIKNSNQWQEYFKVCHAKSPIFYAADTLY